MKKAKWIAAAVVALALAGTAWGFGQAGVPEEDALPGPQMGPRGGMAPDFQEELGLTDEQAEKLRQLRVEAMKNGIRARSEMMIRRMELEELLRADTPDKAAIDAKLRQLTEAQSLMLRQHVEHRLAMAGLLTPEQRTKARTLLRHHMRQRMFERRGGGSGRGMGHGQGFGPGRGPGFMPRRGTGPGPGGPPQD